MSNQDRIQWYIQRKLDYNTPFYATREDARAFVTDMDHFPYKRYFRGVYDSDVPVIMDREAGWHPRCDSCYKRVEPPRDVPKPGYCWETACSAVKPCNAPPSEKPTQCTKNYVLQP